jgi:DNA-binding beta-propeller fold protein YncE
MRNQFLPPILIIYIFSFASCKGQATFGEKYLQVSKIISLPNVKGRIDHLDINLKDQVVYVAALGNNTVEVVDLKSAEAIHSIRGLDEPQGVGYIPQTREIIIANGGNGDCYFYNAITFTKTASIHLSSDADDVRYDSISQKIYVGYGEGAIAVIDANAHKLTGDIKLPAHPEGFQVDKTSGSILVNLPDKNMVGVTDVVHLNLVASWKYSSPTANFPMALDVTNHQAFIGYRHPAKLVSLDTKTGKVISTNNMVSDADDLYIDNEKRRIYVSGGGGYINIFQQDSSNKLKQISGISTRKGARTSLLVPQLKLFILAEPRESGNNAQLIVYNISQ